MSDGISKIIFAYGNLITPSSTVAASSADPLKPVGYTALQQRGVMTHATGCTEESYTITTGESNTFNCAAILDDNLTSEGTIEILGSNDNFATSEVIVPPSVKESNPALFLFDDVGYAKTRFTLRDPSNPDGFIKFGKLFLGQWHQPSVNYGFGFVSFPVDLSEGIETQNKVPMFNEKPFRNDSDLPFVKVPSEDVALLKTLWQAVGLTRPFIVAMDNQNYKELTYYVRFAQSPRPTMPTHLRTSYTLSFTEAL